MNIRKPLVLVCSLALLLGCLFGGGFTSRAESPEPDPRWMNRTDTMQCQLFGAEVLFHTSNTLWRQRVVLDADGSVVYDQKGAPIPMVDEAGKPVPDEVGLFSTMGTTLYRPMLREAILYARANGVEIITVQQGYQHFYQN